jgi:hypothetical protein
LLVVTNGKIGRNFGPELMLTFLTVALRQAKSSRVLLVWEICKLELWF